MCTPTALLITAAAIQGTGDYLGAQAEASTLKFKSQIAENNARVLDIQAEDEELRGAQEGLQLRQQLSTELAASVSQTAGAGVDIGGGTAQEVFLSTERAGVADVIQARLNSKKRVWALKTGAGQQRAQATQLRRGARRTKRLAPLAFIAPIISGAGQAKLATAKTTTQTTSTGRID